MRFNKLFCGCLVPPRTCEGELAALSQELGQAEGFGAFKALVSGDAPNDAAERKIFLNSSSSVRCTRQRALSNPDYLYARGARGRSTSSRALVGGVEYNSFFVNPLAEGSQDEGVPILYAGASIAHAPSSLNNPLAEEFTVFAVTPPGSPSCVRKPLALATPCGWDGNADHSAPTTPGTPSRPLDTFTAVHDLQPPAALQPFAQTEAAEPYGPRATEPFLDAAASEHFSQQQHGPQLSPAQSTAQSFGRAALCGGTPSCPNLQTGGSGGGAPPPHAGAACCGGGAAAVYPGPQGQETPPPSTPSLRLAELRAALTEPSATGHSAPLAALRELFTVQEEQQQEQQPQQEQKKVILATSLSAHVDSRTQSAPALDALLTEPFAPSTPPLAAREVGALASPAMEPAGPQRVAAEEKSGGAPCGGGWGLVAVEEHDPVRRQLAQVLRQTQPLSDGAHGTIGVMEGQREEAAEVQRLEPVEPSGACAAGVLLEGVMTATSTLRLPLPPPGGHRDSPWKSSQPEPGCEAGDAAVLTVAAPGEGHGTVGVMEGQREEAAEVQRLEPVEPSGACAAGVLLEGLMTATSTLRLPMPPPRGRRDSPWKFSQPEPGCEVGDAAVLTVAAPEEVIPICGPDATALVKDVAAEAATVAAADEMYERRVERALVRPSERPAGAASVAYGGSLGGAVGHVKSSSYGGAIQRMCGPLSTPGAPGNDAANDPGCSISGLAMTRALIRQMGLLPAPGLEARDSHVAVATAVVVVAASPAEPPKAKAPLLPLPLSDCTQMDGDGVTPLSPSPFAAACRTAQATLAGDRDGDITVVDFVAKASGCTASVDGPQVGNGLAGVPRSTEVLDCGCDGEAIVCAVSQRTTAIAAGCVPQGEWCAPDGRDGGKVQAGEEEEAAAAAAWSDEGGEGAVGGVRAEEGGEEGSEGGGGGGGGEDEDDEMYSLMSSSSASSLGDADAQEGTGRAMVVVSSRSLQTWLEPQGWTPLRERFGRVHAAA